MVKSGHKTILQIGSSPCLVKPRQRRCAWDPAYEKTAEELGFESPWAITGLYRRPPRTQNTVLDAPMEHDTITLYRGPILLEWIETGEDLFRLIRNVLIQEIAHHFGISTAEILRLEGEG